MNRALGFVAAVAIASCERQPAAAPPPIPPGPQPVASDAALVLDAAGPPTLTARQVVEQRPLGKRITMELIENLYGSGQSSLPSAGEVHVEVIDVGAERFLLRPGITAAERAAGAVSELPSEIATPSLVTGVVAAGTSHPDWTYLVVHAIKPIPLPEPKQLASVAALLADRARYARAYVEVVDDYVVGFEVSSLGGHVWLEGHRNVEVRCPPSKPAGERRYEKARIRARGYAYTEGHYGHLGGSSALIVADRITYLDASKPECR